MKKVLFFLLAATVSSSVFAQDLTSEPVRDVFVEDSPQDPAIVITGVAHIQNTTGAPLDVKWVRENVNMPLAWRASVCDLNLCWPSSTSTQNFTIDPTPAGGRGDILDVQFKPNGVEGIGTVDVACYRVSNNAPLLRITYHCGAYLVGTTQVQTVTANLFPNPTTEVVNITNNTNISNGYLKDVAGATIRSYTINGATAQWQVGDLPKGIYFLDLQNDKAQSLKTIKLVIQ